MKYPGCFHISYSLILALLTSGNHALANRPATVNTAETNTLQHISVPKNLGDGVRFRVHWTNDDYYRVYMKPDTTPTPDLTITAQLTLRVPHATGNDQFVINALKSEVANTEWHFDSRSSSPGEAPGFDYLSLSLTLTSAAAFNWQAGQEIEVFNFKNTGKCSGSVTLIDNQTDPFIIPVNNGGNNSAASNPGNQFNNLGWNSGNFQANNYLGNYGDAAVCIPATPTDNGNSGGESDNGSGGNSGSGPGVNLQVRGILQGAYNTPTGLMRADLNTKDLLPATQPFTDAIVSFDYQGQESLSSLVTSLSDGNAPVDWVLIELLDATDRETRLASKAAILQRDGDIVDAQTGVNTLSFPGVAAGSYYIGLNHRNHLGIVTLNPLALSITPQLVDFSLTTTAVYGAHARYEQSNIAMLWAGEADNNNSIISSGPGNDLITLISRILTEEGNTGFNSNFRLSGYHSSDFNLDGFTLFAGPGNDSNINMTNVLLHPGNSGLSANFVVKGRKPKHKTAGSAAGQND